MENIQDLTNKINSIINQNLYDSNAQTAIWFYINRLETYKAAKIELTEDIILNLYSIVKDEFLIYNSEKLEKEFKNTLIKCIELL